MSDTKATEPDDPDRREHFDVLALTFDLVAIAARFMAIGCTEQEWEKFTHDAWSRVGQAYQSGMDAAHA